MAVFKGKVSVKVKFVLSKYDLGIMIQAQFDSRSPEVKVSNKNIG